MADKIAAKNNIGDEIDAKWLISEYSNMMTLDELKANSFEIIDVLDDVNECLIREHGPYLQYSEGIFTVIDADVHLRQLLKHLNTDTMSLEELKKLNENLMIIKKGLNNG